MGWNNQVIIASQVIIEGSADGLFMYNGTPAKGSLILVISESAGTDPYGNVYAAGFNMGVWSASTGLSLQHFGLDSNGNVYLADATGSTKVYMDTSGNFIGFYPSGAGLHNLTESISTTGGTDKYGNPFLAGFTSYFNAANTLYAQMVNGEILLTGLLPVLAAAAIGVTQVGTGTTLSLTPQTVTGEAVPNTLNLQSPNAGNALQWGGPAAIGGAVTATGGTPAKPTLVSTSTWTTVNSGAGTGTFGTGFAAGSPAPQYLILPIGGTKNMLFLRGVVSVTAATVASGSTMITLPSMTFGQTTKYSFPNSLSGYAAGNASFSINGGGTITNQASGVSGNTVTLDGAMAAFD